MKRKNSNVLKLKDFFIKDKKVKDIYSKFKQVLSRYKKNSFFVASISGGPDSMALAFLSKLLMDQTKYRIHFVLVDHGLRKNSKKEALKVNTAVN